MAVCESHTARVAPAMEAARTAAARTAAAREAAARAGTIRGRAALPAARGFGYPGRTGRQHGAVRGDPYARTRINWCTHLVGSSRPKRTPGVNKQSKTRTHRGASGHHTTRPRAHARTTTTVAVGIRVHVSTRARVIGRPLPPGTSAPRHRRGRPAAPRHLHGQRRQKLVGPSEAVPGYPLPGALREEAPWVAP